MNGRGRAPLLSHEPVASLNPLSLSLSLSFTFASNKSLSICWPFRARSRTNSDRTNKRSLPSSFEPGCFFSASSFKVIWFWKKNEKVDPSLSPTHFRPQVDRSDREAILNRPRESVHPFSREMQPPQSPFQGDSVSRFEVIPVEKILGSSIGCFFFSFVAGRVRSLVLFFVLM